jgi:hypothetical protein
VGSHVVVVAGADCREAVDYGVDCYMPADVAAADVAAVDAAAVDVVVVDVAPADIAAAAAADAVEPDGFLHLDFPVQKDVRSQHEHSEKVGCVWQTDDCMLPVDDSP